MKAKTKKNAALTTAAGILAGALCLCILASCGEKVSEGVPGKTKKPPLVEVAPVVTGVIARTVRLPGTIRPAIVANVLSSAEGKITALDIREGDFVTKDAVIGRISPSVREDILNAARLRNDQDGDLEFALNQYREIPIVAPTSGVVAVRSAQPGDMVVQRQKLLEVQSMCATCLHVEIPVPEREMPFITKGMAARISPDARPGETFSGSVTRVYPRLEEKTRTGTVEVGLPANAAKRLKTGMFARVSFQVQQVDDALLVPAEAVVLTAKGTNAVFTVKEGKAAMRLVRLGLESDGKVQILDGVTAEEMVVVAGNENLKDGGAVRLPGVGKRAAGGKKQGGAK